MATLLSEMASALLHHSDWDLIGLDGEPVQSLKPVGFTLGTGHVRIGRDSDAMDAPTYDLNYVNCAVTANRVALDPAITRFIRRAGFRDISNQIYFNGRRAKDLGTNDFMGPMVWAFFGGGIGVCFFGFRRVRHGITWHPTFEAFMPVRILNSCAEFYAGTIYRVSVSS